MRTYNLLAGKLILPFEGRLPAIVLSSAAICLWKHSGEAERSYGIGLKLFAFIPEPVFTFIPGILFEIIRNTVRNHPGIAFILPRNPH